MKSALTLAGVLSHHALAAFDLMGADPSLDAARRVWRWVERNRKNTFTAKEVFDALRGHFKRMHAIDPAFEVLIERFYIFELKDETRGPGRPSRMFRVNPVLAEPW